jgi:hypothetical protein
VAYREGKQKRRTGRLPHRNHLQITLIREIALLTKADMETMTLEHISHAVSQPESNAYGVLGGGNGGSTGILS